MRAVLMVLVPLALLLFVIYLQLLDTGFRL